MVDKFKVKFRTNLTSGNSEWPSAAAGMVAMEVFLSVPCKWSLIEIVPGEMETLDSSNNSPSPTEGGFLRVQGGSKCREPGFYFMPLIVDSRRFFVDGKLLPDFDA